MSARSLFAGVCRAGTLSKPRAAAGVVLPARVQPVRWNATASPSAAEGSKTDAGAGEGDAETDEATRAAVEQEMRSSVHPIPIRYPYFIPRVGVYGMNFPVYSDVRRGGQKWLTVVRKVEGDAAVRCASGMGIADAGQALCRDMFETFGWGDPFDKQNPGSTFLERISSGPGSKSVVLRGNFTRELRAWLEQRGF